MPYQYFKMEDLQLIKDLLREGDYMCKIDLRDAYYTILIHQKYRKYLRFKWERTLYKVPLLWTRPSTSDIYKINESPYCSTAVPKHLLNKIPGWHADNGQVSTGFDLSSRHCDLPPVESRICNEFKEVSSGTISENRIFRNGHRFNKDGILIASGEACKTNVTILKSSREQRDYHHGPNKVNWETRINCPSNTARTTSSSILPTFANPGIKTFKCYHAKVHLDKDAKDKRFWWIENLRLYNGKSLIFPQTDLYISTDASTKGGRPHARAYQQAVRHHRKNGRLPSTY